MKDRRLQPEAKILGNWLGFALFTQIGMQEVFISIVIMELSVASLVMPKVETSLLSLKKSTRCHSKKPSRN
jgi:hypothetical protein